MIRKFCSFSRIPARDRQDYYKSLLMLNKGADLFGLDRPVDKLGIADISFIRKLRTDILMLLKSQDVTVQERKRLDALNTKSFAVLKTHFTPETIVLRRINAKTAHPDLISTLARAETVLSSDEKDVLRRLQGSRRIYAYFHITDVNNIDPLAFVNVSLSESNNVPSTLNNILSSDTQITKVTPTSTVSNSTMTTSSSSSSSSSGMCEHEVVHDYNPLCMTFYSVNAVDPSLQGLQLGGKLIHSVISQLRNEYPSLVKGYTLSPVPGLLEWCFRMQNGSDSNSNSRSDKKTQFPPAVQNALHIIHSQPDWYNNAEQVAQLEKPLMWLAVKYLTSVRDINKGKERCKKHVSSSPIDSVFRFHLNNGAKGLHRINYMGSTYEKCIKQSAGILVNYMYTDDEDIENEVNRIEEQEQDQNASIDQQNAHKYVVLSVPTTDTIRKLKDIYT
jgi:hypothetical protein